MATFWSGVEAHLARLKLEDADLPCMLVDEFFPATHYCTVGSGGVKLQVPAECAEQARRVLAAGRAAGQPGDDEPPAVMLRQPRVIGHFRDEVEATMSAAVLEEQGIACELIVPRTLFRRPIVLKVAEADVAEARLLLSRTPAQHALLDAAAAETGGHEEDEPDVSLVCPACLSVQVRRPRWAVPLLVAALLMTAVLAAGPLGMYALLVAAVAWTLAILVRPRSRCLDCDHVWRER